MLTGHKGKCANLHGHTYTVEVTVRAGLVKTQGSSKDMVIDLADLTKVVNEHIIDVYDHAFIADKTVLNSECCEAAIVKCLMDFGLKVVVMPYRTTAENMAMTFYTVLFNVFKDEYGVILDSVKVWETPKGCAEYTR